jgi:DNA-binding transcriptional LysR family regulator
MAVADSKSNPRTSTGPWQGCIGGRVTEIGALSAGVKAAPRQTVSIVYMVATGFGVSIVPQSLEQLHAEGVAYLRIEGDVPRALVSLAYRRGDRSPVVRNFVALARRTAQSQSLP